MSECPYCQASIEESAIFCRSCGASLRLPEYDRAFCPHCGARVSSRQEFCHECHWSLVQPATEGPALKPEPPPITARPSPWKNPWVWGVLAGTGLIIALLPWLFVPRASHPPGPEPLVPKIVEEKAVLKSPSPAAPLPGLPGGEDKVAATAETPASPEVLKSQLAEILNQLREAQLKKDLSQYGQAFSPNFPDLDKRRQKTLAVWEAYDYSSLDFDLEDIKLLEPDRAFARVTWTIKTQNKKTQNIKTDTHTYNVWFAKDAGKWRISKLEMVSKPG